jgi:hypothetical protein
MSLRSGLRLWRQDVLQRALAAGLNPLLYTACRDFEPPRRVVTAGLLDVWHLDVVAYRSGELPSGEAFRSIGHWNPIDEFELFQVLRGRAVVAWLPRGMSSQLRAVVAEQGDVVTMPAGSWHVTYPLKAETLIANAYSDGTALPPESGSKYAARCSDSPLVVLRRRDGECALYWGDLLIPVEIDAHASVPPDWLAGETLVSLFREADDELFPAASVLMRAAPES